MLSVTYLNALDTFRRNFKEEDHKDELKTTQTAALHLLSSAVSSISNGAYSEAWSSCDAVVDRAHELLNSVPYHAVPTTWRRLYAWSNILRSACDRGSASIETSGGREGEEGEEEIGTEGERASEKKSRRYLKRALKSLDMALVVAGAPECRDTILRCVEDVSSELIARSHGKASPSSKRPSGSLESGATKRPRGDAPSISHSSSGRRYPSVDIPRIRYPVEINETPPDLFAFGDRVRGSEDARTPVVVKGAMDHWPALTTRPWSDMEYLKRTAGSARTVPVEIGSKYTDDEWSQRMMSFGEFIDRYVLGRNEIVEGAENDDKFGDKEDKEEAKGKGRRGAVGGGEALGATQEDAATDDDATHREPRFQKTSTLPQPPSPIAYLAQHALFDQIPRLRDDIHVPDYCFVRSDDEEDIDVNAWFGPAGTVSPLHHDGERHNLLAQIVGSKYVRLYAPGLSDALYAHEEDGLLSNTSEVDVENPDTDRFPKFSGAKYEECILEPGDMLYIPVKSYFRLT